ncbi:MAG: hypothetical protein ACFFCO_07365 [Promethearchaeota archaeon]
MSLIVESEVVGHTVSRQALLEGYHRAAFTLTNESLTVVEPFLIMDATVNFTLFVACNDTTGFLLINISRELAPLELIILGEGTNTTRQFLSASFGVTLYSNGTSLGYYWYDSRIQGGWQPPLDLIWLIGIVIAVSILCVAFIYYRRRNT